MVDKTGGGGGARESSIRIGVSLGNSAENLNRVKEGLNQVADAGTRAGRSAKDSGASISRATDEQRAALERLIGVIDPAGRRLGELAQQQEALRAAFKQGFLPKDSFNDYNAMIEKAQNADFSRFIANVDPARAALERLTTAERELQQFHAEGALNTDEYARYAAVLRSTRAELDGTTAAMAKESTQLAQLRAQLDPVGAAMQRLARTRAELDAQFSKGNLGAEEHRRLTAALDQQTAALERNQHQLQGNAISSKQLAAANRMLPAQFTDIVVSLQGGQAPLTVMLQQGGQIKDMYGGIVPAFRALGTYALGLVNPITLSVAAVGALAYSVYSASTRFADLNRQMIISGHGGAESLVVVRAAAAGLAHELGGIGDSVAAGAIAQVAQNGKIAFDDFIPVAQAAIEMQRSAGQEIRDTVSEYANLGTGGEKALLAINEKYNFLDVAQFKHLQNLYEVGKGTQAADEAQQLYLANLKKVAAEAEANLTPLARLWRAVADTAREAGQEMAVRLGYGTKLQDLQRQLKDVEAGVHTPSNLRRQAALQNQINQEQANERIRANAAKTDDHRVAIDRLHELDRVREQNYSKEERRAADRKRLVNSLRENGASEAEIASEAAKFDRNHAEHHRHRQPKAYRDEASVSELARLKETEASLRAQLTANEKLGAQARQLAQFDERINELRGKPRLTAEQQSILRSAAQIRQQLTINAGLEKEIQHREALSKFRRAGDSLVASLGEENTNTRAQYGRELGSVGLGSQARERVAALAQITEAENKAIRQLSKSADEGGISGNEYTEQVERVRQMYAERYRLAEEHYAAVDELNSHWLDGMRTGYATYIEGATNVSASTQRITTDALTRSEQAFASYVTTGKGGFSELVSSMLADAARLAAQQGMLQLFGLMGGMFGGGLSSGGLGGASALMGLTGKNDISQLALHRATGGPVQGPGTTTSDSIPAWLSNGEFVMNAKATAQNRSVLERMNSGQKFASGGAVDGSRHAVASGPQVTMGDLHIHANSEEEGRDAMTGVMEAMKRDILAQARAEARQDMITQRTRPGGLLR